MLGAVYVYDTSTKGLCVRLTPAKVMYVFYIWHAGRPQRLTLGEVGQVQLRQIRQIVAALLGDLAHGVDVFARAKHKKQAEAPLTLNAAFERHLARPDLRDSTRRDQESLWRRVPARLKARALTDVTTDDLSRLHSSIGARHKRTANKIVAIVSALMRRSGRLRDNPAEGIVRFREEPRQHVLTMGELQRLRDVLEETVEPWRSFFTLAMLTGARRGSLARMRWVDLDLDAAVWRLPATWSKNRKVLTVALPSEAVAILREMYRRRGLSPWVFPSWSASGHIADPKPAWVRVCRKAGVEGAVIHDLRRTIGTLVAADGAGAAVISAVLGHTDLRSAKSYIHLSAEMARDAVEGVAQRMRRRAA
jgi:integrase